MLSEEGPCEPRGRAWGVQGGCLEKVTSACGFAGVPDQVGEEKQSVGLPRVSRLSPPGHLHPYPHRGLPLCTRLPPL